MRELRFETGVEEFEVNGCGVLRFNPTEPGLYTRFAAFCEELPALVAAAAGDGAAGDGSTGDETGDPAAFLARMDEADRAVKEKLAGVFGPGNDVAGVFAGVNLLGLTPGGATALENLMDALAPVIRQSAEAREAELKKRAAGARGKAEAARAARGGKG